MRVRPYFAFFLWLGLWVLQWWLIPLHYIRTQELGYYPPEADSIGIPVLGAWMMILFGGLFLAVGFWVCIRRARPEFLQWKIWSPATPARSMLWTAVFGFLTISTVFSIQEHIEIGLPLNAWADVGWLYVHPSLRAIIVAGLRSDYSSLQPEIGGITSGDPPVPEDGRPAE